MEMSATIIVQDNSRICILNLVCEAAVSTDSTSEYDFKGQRSKFLGQPCNEQ